MRSTSGTCFNLGSRGVSWCSRKQDTIADAKFIVATIVVSQAVWLLKIMCDMNMEQKEAIEVYIDSQASIPIANTLLFRGRTKHFNVKLFFSKDVNKDGDVKLLYYQSDEQVANIFTKPFPLDKFEFFRKKL